LGHATGRGVKTKIKDVHELYENALWTNGISLFSASSTKPLEGGERDFELGGCRRRTV